MSLFVQALVFVIGVKCAETKKSNSPEQLGSVHTSTYKLHDVKVVHQWCGVVVEWTSDIWTVTHSMYPLQDQPPIQLQKQSINRKFLQISMDIFHHRRKEIRIFCAL